MTVAFTSPKPQALAWIDIETPGLPNTAAPWDYSGCMPLEIAMILTDFDLTEFGGYTALITPTPESVAALRNPGNAMALEMHQQSGLIQALSAAVKAGETESLLQAEENLIKTLTTRSTFEKGEFMLAGSGVGAFDYMVLKRFMPRLCQWFAYYPFDIGVVRRVGKVLSGGRDLVNPSLHSYGDLKEHRALADIKAHLDEAREWQKVFMKVPTP